MILYQLMVLIWENKTFACMECLFVIYCNKDVVLVNKLNNMVFTLVEILAVVAIIAIIGLIAVPSVLSVINTGKNGSYDLLVKNIKTASINLYDEVEYMDTDIYYYDIDGISGEKIKIIDSSIEVNLQTLVINGFFSVTGDGDKKINDDKVTQIIESLSTDESCPSSDDYAS